MIVKAILITVHKCPKTKNVPECPQVSKNVHKYPTVNLSGLPPFFLKEVRERAPHVPITAIIEFEHEMDAHLSNNPNFFAIEYEMASEKNLHTLRSQDKKIFVWTVDDAHKIEDLITKQIDGIITNKP